MATNQRYDVLYPRNYKARDGQERTDWLRVGVAFEGDRQFNLTLYTVPTGAEMQPGGGIRLVLRVADQATRGQQYGGRGPEVQQRRPQRQEQGAPADWDRAAPGPDDTDNIPF